MPNRTIYIRNEDLPLWDKCTAKSELMHEALQGKYGVTVSGSIPKIYVDEAAGLSDKTVEKLAKTIKTPADAKKAVAKENFCEHGFAPGFCKHAKCKNASR